MLLLALPALGSELTETPLDLTNEHLVTAWQTDDGLPQNEVTSLAQTREGYLWIGLLHGGLARFDGVRFTQFTPFDTTELRAIEVQGLETDSRGRLWIGPSDGSLATWSDGRFTLQRPPQRDGGLRLQAVLGCQTNQVVLAAINRSLMLGTLGSDSSTWQVHTPPAPYPLPSFCRDASGAIWYRTAQNELARLLPDDLSKVEIIKEPAIRSVMAVCADATGNIFVGTTKGIQAWQGGRFQDFTPTNGPAAFNVARMVCARDGGLWVLESGYMRKCVNRKWVTEVRLGGPQFRPRGGYLFGDSQGGAWLVSSGEAVWHILPTGAVTKFTEKDGLPSLQITAWLEDRDGNVWFGTAGKGIVRIRRRLFHLANTPDLPDNVIRSVAEDQAGTIWLGTASGQILALRGQDCTRLDLSPVFSKPVMKDAVLCPDQEGRLWIASMESGVLVKEGDRLRRPFEASALGPGARILCADRQGRVWFGSEFGLSYWQADRLRKFTPEEVGPRCHVTGIAEDASGTVWITTAGCQLLRFERGSLTRFQGGPSFAKSRFWCVLPDAGGVVWIGTLGGGLVRFQQGQFVCLTLTDGLPDNTIAQLLDDRQGSLWAGSRGGVFRIEKQQIERYVNGVSPRLVCEVFDRSDGLPTIECSGGQQPSCWRGDNGRLWFATMKGAVWVNPNDIPTARKAPPIVLEEVWVDGKHIHDGPQPAPAARVAPAAMFDAHRTLRILPGRHYLDLHFTGLNLSSPDKVRYRWKMEGIDADWRDGGRSRNIAYSALPHGEFVFRVQACNGSDAWGPDEARLSIMVLPHFWETWWFRGLMGCLIGALLWGAHALRVARLREIERLRLHIARDLHDEVGAKLGAIALLGELIDEETASADGPKVRQLALQTIDALRDIVWFIDPSHERLTDLVQRMETVAKSLLPGLELQCLKQGDFDSTHLPLAFRRNVIPLLKESLGNITKHSRADRVEMLVQRRNGLFVLEIKDNGCGFDPNTPTWGNGLNNIRQRASAMNASLEIQSTPGTGACVRLTAPIP